jgi:hypothetical protein
MQDAAWPSLAADERCLPFGRADGVANPVHRLALVAMGVALPTIWISAGRRSRQAAESLRIPVLGCLCGSNWERVRR